jgi:hypothetical protein
MILAYDMSGRAVDANADLAAGYYIFDNPEDANVPGGCGGLAAGFIEVGGGNRIKTCGGKLQTEHLPDFVLVDDWFKVLLKPLLIVAIVLLLVAIYKNVK